MPRPRKPARLVLRPARANRAATWVIADGSRETSTGCREADVAGAQVAFEAYLAGKHRPPENAPNRLEDLLVADVLNIYLAEHAARSPSRDFIRHTAAPVLEWWGARSLAEIRARTCQDYVDWRVRQGRGVSDQTARHDLKTLRAAINYYNREHGPLPGLPAVTMPVRSAPRERWLSRVEVAAMLRAALHGERCRHVARLILLGVYTGTRSGAMLRLKWLPSIDGGWIDIEGGVIHRRARGARDTRKRQPPVRIPDRLRPHLVRWRAADRAEGIVHVVHYFGAPIVKLRRSWPAVRARAGLGDDVVVHTLRHTATTWLMQSGVDIFEAAGFLGMSEETLREVYGHHHVEFQERAANASRRRAGRESGNARHA